jgi:D-lactate dehydrogenase (cytochrome)
LGRAHDAATPVTVAAGLTGLAGAAVPGDSGLLVDMTAFDTLPDRSGFRRAAPFLLISDEDPFFGLVAPGVPLAALKVALEGLNLWYPPHPGELRATLGGNVAANASGPRTFSFGATREYVESLRVILADGDVLDLRRGCERVSAGHFSVATECGRVIEGRVPVYKLPAIKNAAGLFAAPEMDLLDLFIGSEGILGTFSEIGLRFLPRRAFRLETLVFGTEAEALACADALRPLRVDRKRYPDPAGDGIVSLEFFDGASLRLARAAGVPASALDSSAGAALGVETFADDAETRARILQVADALHCRGLLPDAESDAIRYAVPRRVAELLKERGRPKFGTDFAVPVDRFAEMYAFYEEMEVEFGRGESPHAVRAAKWGHIGDCHLHCNFLCESDADEALARSIYLRLARKAVSLGGTVSAEHGVGKKRLADESGTVRPYLWYLLGDAYREIAETKRAFDPKGILNRGNMGV